MCIHKAENEWQARQATPAASQQQHPSQAAGWEMKWEKVHFSMFSKALKPKLIDIKISHEHTPANIFIYISVNFPHLSEISDGLCCVCMLTPSRHDWRGLVFTLLFFLLRWSWAAVAAWWNGIFSAKTCGIEHNNRAKYTTMSTADLSSIWWIRGE